MCFDFFGRTKRKVREEVVKEEMKFLNPAARKSFYSDEKLNEKKRYRFALNIKKYKQEYSNIYGTQRVEKLFSGLDYITLKSMHLIKERLSNIVKPEEINELMLKRTKQLEMLKKTMEVIDKQLDEKRDDSEQLPEYFEALKRKRFCLASLKRIKFDYLLLNNINEATKELKIEKDLKSNDSRKKQTLELAI